MAPSSNTSRASPSSLLYRPSRHATPVVSRTLDLARAYNLTPPPDDNISAEITAALHGRCIIKIREEIDVLKDKCVQAQHTTAVHRSPTQSPSRSYQSVYEGFREQLDELKDVVERIDTSGDEVTSRLDELNSSFGELRDSIEKVDEVRYDIEEIGTWMGSLEGSITQLGRRIDGVEERLDRRIDEVEVSQVLNIPSPDIRS